MDVPGEHPRSRESLHRAPGIVAAAPVHIPQPDEVSKAERGDATASYLMMFGSSIATLPLPIVNLVASVVFFLVHRNKSRFVAFHSYQSMLGQVPVSILNMSAISWLIYALVSDSGWGLLGGYAAAVAIVNVVYIVLSLVAASKAYKGQLHYMPVFGKHAFERYFGPHARPLRQGTEPVPPNRPPA